MSDSKFIENTDLSDGKYSLYIKHKAYGEFIVLDEKAIKENTNYLKIKVSFINYLPAEGDRSFGAVLFKNNESIRAIRGGVFRYFEIGTLADYAIPVKTHRTSGTKKQIQEKLDSIKNNENVFIVHKPEFVADNSAFRFRVYFPSISVPVTKGKDDAGYKKVLTVNGVENNRWKMKEEDAFEKHWASQLENCIREKAGTISDFKVSIIKNSLSDANIFDTTTEEQGELKGPDNNFLYINDYMYYNFEAYIMANKENAEKLLEIDYSACLSEEDRNRPQVIAKMKQLVQQSTKPQLNVVKGEVGLSGYKDDTSKYEELYEQTYSLFWLETEN